MEGVWASVRILPRCLFQAHSTGRRYWGIHRIHWGDYIFNLDWKHLGKTQRNRKTGARETSGIPCLAISQLAVPYPVETTKSQLMSRHIILNDKPVILHQNIHVVQHKSFTTNCDILTCWTVWWNVPVMIIYYSCCQEAELDILDVLVWINWEMLRGTFRFPGCITAFIQITPHSTVTTSSANSLGKRQKAFPDGPLCRA